MGIHQFILSSAFFMACGNDGETQVERDYNYGHELFVMARISSKEQRCQLLLWSLVMTSGAYCVVFGRFPMAPFASSLDGNVV